MRSKAVSKINLFLRVCEKRSDGYHEIETVFIPLADIYDFVEITPTTNNKITVSSSSSLLPLNEDNICYKAAYKYLSLAKIKDASFNIHITKRIPIAAGMGGGSSDAATVLSMLQNIHNSFTDEQLRDIAAIIGADVSYFLNPVPAVGKGIGEKITPIQLCNQFYVVILAPLFPVSAAWGYKNMIKAVPEYSIEKVVEVLAKGNVNQVAKVIYNDLAFALYKKFPLLKILKNDLLKNGALNAEITGSGPTLFGIFDNKELADMVSQKISILYGDAVMCLSSPIYSKKDTNTDGGK